MALRHLFLSLLTIVALSSCAGQSRREDDRIFVTAVNLHKGQLTLIFKRTGEVRAYYVNGLTFIAVPSGAGQLRDIYAGEEVYSYHESNRYTLDSIIVGHFDPIDYF
jgi:hypothetical protein